MACFAAGMLLSIACVHIMPEATALYEAYGNEVEGEHALHEGENHEDEEHEGEEHDEECEEEGDHEEHTNEINLTAVENGLEVY